MFSLTWISVPYLVTSSFYTVGTFLCSFRVISATFGFIPHHNTFLSLITPGEKCEEQHNNGLHDDDGEDVTTGPHGLWSVSSHGDGRYNLKYI